MPFEYPDKLKVYTFHGLRPTGGKNHEWTCDCPFCGKEGHFSINDTNGLSKCLVCGVSGDSGKPGLNEYSFIRRLHEVSYEATSAVDYHDLAEQIGVLDIQSLVEWQLARSIITGEWLIPGYNAQCSLVTLYAYYKETDPKTGKSRHFAKPTTNLGHQLHGMNLWDKSKPIVYVCEGWKDAIILWECLTKAKTSEYGLAQTSSRDSSLYAQANVIAIAGSLVFFESWLPLFENKVVNLLYDSDHPRKHQKTKHVTPGSGWVGMERATRLMSTSKYKPQEINCIYWGSDGYDPSKKSGYDVRDHLTEVQ